MSFGLLKHFSERPKHHGPAAVRFADAVVLGGDLAAVLKLVELRRTRGPERLKLVAERRITKQLLLDHYQGGVAQIRSEAAVGEIFKLRHDVRFIPQTADPVFYKDGKFHEFGGRAKSMELQAGEAFFQRRGYRLDVASLFAADDWANLDAIIADHLELRILAGVEKTTPADLVEKREWTLTFKDFQELACEELYVALPPQKFLARLRNREALTPELIDFCSATEALAGIAVTWVLNREVQSEDRTLFLPQSMTHERGHFLVEFEAFEHATGTQKGHALFLTAEDEPQAEDLAARIRLLKRVVDRVFPNFEQHITAEVIRYEENMFLAGQKPELAEQLSFDYPTLAFLGAAAPAATDEKFLARVLLS